MGNENTGMRRLVAVITTLFRPTSAEETRG